MSRIGKLPVEIPAGVTITVGDKEITVAGPKGTLMVPVQQNTTTKVEENKIVVTRYAIVSHLAHFDCIRDCI